MKSQIQGICVRNQIQNSTATNCGDHGPRLKNQVCVNVTMWVVFYFIGKGDGREVTCLRRQSLLQSFCLDLIPDTQFLEFTLRRHQVNSNHLKDFSHLGSWVLSSHVRSAMKFPWEFSESFSSQGTMKPTIYLGNSQS